MISHANPIEVAQFLAWAARAQHALSEIDLLLNARGVDRDNEPTRTPITDLRNALAEITRAMIDGDGRGVKISLKLDLDIEHMGGRDQ